MNEKIVLNYLDAQTNHNYYVTVPLDASRLGFARIIENTFKKHPAWALTGIDINPGKVDTVTVTCYGKTKSWWRPDALAFFRAGVESCEGSERDRYLTIVMQLESGATVCSDEGVSI